MKKSLGITLGIFAIGIVLLVIFVFPTNKKSPETDGSPDEISTLSAQEGLPEAVETKRQAIYVAAMAKDYDALTALTDPATFKYSFGGDYEGGFSAWRRHIDNVQPADNTFTSIPELLNLPYAYIEESDIYVWPSYFPKSVEAWTEEDVGIMKLTMTDEEIQGYRQAGGYLGYRLGIRGNGTWIYYLAGD